MDRHIGIEEPDFPVPTRDDNPLNGALGIGQVAVGSESSLKPELEEHMIVLPSATLARG
jgi:hypothetical protein